MYFCQRIWRDLNFSKWLSSYFSYQQPKPGLGPNYCCNQVPTDAAGSCGHGDHLNLSFTHKQWPCSISSLPTPATILAAPKKVHILANEATVPSLGQEALGQVCVGETLKAADGWDSLTCVEEHRQHKLVGASPAGSCPLQMLTGLWLSGYT